jgi:hypothetical protein
MRILKVETASFRTTVENQQNRKPFRFSIIMQIDFRNERSIEMKSNKLQHLIKFMLTFKLNNVQTKIQ